MPRIRSIHPGQWSNGSFVACTPLARLLCLALRNIADDRGVFRWKPLDIKMQCLPGDNCNVEELLIELVGNEQITEYELGGKKYGLIRDFTQWQSPRSPKCTHPIPANIRAEFGLDEHDCDLKEGELQQNAEIDSVKPAPFPQNAEIDPEREEGGGKREEIRGMREEGDGVAPAQLESLSDQSLAIHFMDVAQLDPQHRMNQTNTVRKWRRDTEAQGVPLIAVAELLAERTANKRDGPARSLSYFNQPIADMIRAYTEPMPEGKSNGKTQSQSSNPFANLPDEGGGVDCGEAPGSYSRDGPDRDCIEATYEARG